MTNSEIAREIANEVRDNWWRIKQVTAFASEQKDMMSGFIQPILDRHYPPQPVVGLGWTESIIEEAFRRYTRSGNWADVRELVTQALREAAAQAEAERELRKLSNASVMNGLRRIAKALGDDEPQDLGAVHALAGLVEYAVEKKKAVCSALITEIGEAGRDVAEQITAYLTLPDSLEPDDSCGSPTEYIAGIVTSALHAAREEGRKEGLLHAARTVCAWCGNHYGRNDVPIVPERGVEWKEQWFHGSEQHGFMCYATKIWDVLAASGKDDK